MRPAEPRRNRSRSSLYDSVPPSSNALEPASGMWDSGGLSGLSPRVTDENRAGNMLAWPSQATLPP